MVIRTMCSRMDSSNPFDDSIFPEFSVNNLNVSNATSVITSSKSLCANDNRNHSIQVMLGLQQSDLLFSISPSDPHQMDEHHLTHHHAEDINSIFNSTSPSMVNTVVTTQTIKARPISPCTTTSQASPPHLAQHMPKVTTPSTVESVTTTTSEEKIKHEVDTTCNVQTSGMIYILDKYHSLLTNKEKEKKRWNLFFFSIFIMNISLNSKFRTYWFCKHALL